MKTLQDIPTKNFINGGWTEGDGRFPVLNKYTQDVIAEVSTASPVLMTSAVDSAYTAFQTGLLTPYERYEVLMRACGLISARYELFRSVIIAEAGFTCEDADGEIRRAVQTLQASAEEAKRLVGEMIPFEGAPGTGSRMGFTMRFPIGLVLAITPFNSPLNTVSHKVGPAFAAGNAVILKPSSKTPLTANLLAACFAEAGAPNGSITVLHGEGRSSGALIENEKINYIAFTGSTGVGRAIQASAGLRKTQMELGSIAGTIVCRDADLVTAAVKCARASFRKAGQICTSIQLLLVQHEVMADFAKRFLEEVGKMQVGNPADPEIAVGPVISIDTAKQIELMIQDALAKGAKCLIGGTRDGACIEPTVLSNTDERMRTRCEEIFGPVVQLIGFADLDEAISIVNSTPYGLATGIFTRDISTGFKAAKQLHVGVVHINETSSSRVDIMPYGGVKESGFGQEGPKYAIREMTEERLVTIRY